MRMQSYQIICGFFFFSSRRRHTRLQGDWSSDVCSSDLDLVREQAWPDPETADELHDALLVMGAVPSVEAGRVTSGKGIYDRLRRAGRGKGVDGRLWIATDGLPMAQAAFAGAPQQRAVPPTV